MVLHGWVTPFGDAKARCEPKPPHAEVARKVPLDAKAAPRRVAPISIVRLRRPIEIGA